MLYLVRAGKDGPAKIGRAANVASRVASLQTASSVELVIVGVAEGDLKEEAKLHKKFGHLRLRGEWFAWTPDMQKHFEPTDIVPKSGSRYVPAEKQPQYPAAETVAAFGGPTKMAAALAVQKGNISRWQSSKSGLIPRWWSVAIKAVAAEKKIKLPKPQKAA